MVKWLVLKFRPLQEVEDPNFRSLLATANTNTPVLTKHQIKTRILETARQALQEMKAYTASTLKEKKVTITTDGWDGYLTVTVHFITPGWKLQSYDTGLMKTGAAGQTADVHREVLKTLLLKTGLQEKSSASSPTPTAAW